jgi:hypothetical protein
MPPGVAVGTTITDRPPHRTVPGASTHTAPTLDYWRAMLLLAHRSLSVTRTAPHCVGPSSLIVTLSFANSCRNRFSTAFTSHPCRGWESINITKSSAKRAY